MTLCGGIVQDFVLSLEYLLLICKTSCSRTAILVNVVKC